MSKPKKTAATKQAATEEKPALEAATTKATKKAQTKARWQRLDDGPAAHADAPAAGRAEPKATLPKSKAAWPPAATLDDDSGDLVVFAFRMSRAEREEIHDAAGPAKASRFVRTVVLAAARGDLATIQAAVKETRKTAAS